MGILTLLTACLALYKMKPSTFFNVEYLEKKCTESVKGIFVLTVLTGHLSQYVTLDNVWYNFPYILVDDWIAQCIVAPFLFLSGYGMFCSFMKGGKAYIRRIPKKRILITLLHFDMGILLFGVMNLVLGNRYSIREYLTALVGWNSVGNSTWYIFAILCMYLLCYIAGLVANNTRKPEMIYAVLVFGGTVGYIFILKELKQEVYYNTILCFPVGVFFGLNKRRIDRLFSKNNVWCLAIVGLAIAYLFGIMYTNSYYFKAPIFALLVVVFTMHVRICNPILDWLGRHIFEIYLLQRIPQIVFSTLGFNNNQFVFIVLCVPTTLVMVLGFEKIEKYVDRKIGTYDFRLQCVDKLV